MNKTGKTIAVLLAALFLCTGCSGEKIPPKLSEVGFYLDTVITLTAYTEDKQILKDALQECGRYEQLLSRTVEGSDVWRINHAEGTPVEVPDDTIAILQCAKKIGDLSGGAFDVTIAPVSTLWDFKSGEHTLPDADAIDRAAGLVDYTRMKIEGKTVTLPAGMMIDLGGIAKGFTGDRVGEIFSQYNIQSGIISLGGNVQAYGTKTNGKPWRVAIQNPENSMEYLGVLDVQDKAVVTSGGYERFFEENGVRYHHIIDPRTGYPADSGLISATIVCEKGILADGLSTSLFIMGKDQAEKFWRESDLYFDYILEDKEGTLYVTEGIADSLMTDAKVEVVYR